MFDSEQLFPISNYTDKLRPVDNLLNGRLKSRNEEKPAEYEQSRVLD